MTILENIVAYKKREVGDLKRRIRYTELEKSRHFHEEGLSLSASLSNRHLTGIIAEFKRMSPSKGIINTVSQVGKVTTGYASAGASGLSILTDRKFFGGSCSDLTRAKELNSIPVLRKDFIVDEYQIIESKAAGADAILIIAALLGKNQVRHLSELCRALGMEVLLEVHRPDELEMADDHVDIIGVNNRDLNTFEVRVDTSLEMAAKIPGHFLKISESGITSTAMVKQLSLAGYNGFLVGEFFMRSSDPAGAFSDFVKEITD